MENGWTKNCKNCEHFKVCASNLDMSINYGSYICDNWYGWIPVEAEMPKEHESYIEDEPITVSDQVFVKIFDQTDETICYGTMRTLDGKFQLNYASLKATHWKPCV